MGGLKYVDEATGAVKSLKRATKATDNLMDTGGDMVYNGARAAGKIELKPKALMDELATSGKKYTPQDVVMVTKNSNGDLLWLEQGNNSAGLKHVRQRHGADFEARGITVEEVPQVLKEVLQTEPIKTGCVKHNPFSIYAYNGSDFLVAHGTNGYIVSFYPYSTK